LQPVPAVPVCVYLVSASSCCDCDCGWKQTITSDAFPVWGFGLVTYIWLKLVELSNDAFRSPSETKFVTQGDKVLIEIPDKVFPPV